jgi:hypothetical protein
MEFYMRRSYVSRVVTGLCIIAAGILVLGQVANLWDVGDLSKSWWTLFIIIPGITGIASSGFRFWNVFLVFIGVWLLAVDQNWIGDNTRPYFFGAFLVIFGIYVITGGSHWHHDHNHDHDHDHNGSYKRGKFNDDNNDYPEYVTVFSSLNYKNKSQSLRGGKATSVFGSMSVDMTEINISGNAYFEVASVFGGLEIIAPKNVPLKVNITPVFGSFYNDAAYVTPADGQPFLEIKGSSVFGSITVT